MEREEIAKKVKLIIALKTNDDSINEETNLREDLGFDSLDEIELVMETEKEFDISIPDEKGIGIHTIGDVINIVEKYLSPKPAA